MATRWFDPVQLSSFRCSSCKCGKKEIKIMAANSMTVLSVHTMMLIGSLLIILNIHTYSVEWGLTVL